jgi:hypothetical protein
MAKTHYRLRLDARHELNRYVDLVVNPTLDDLQRDLLSPRKVFIACLVTAHCIDRVTDQPAHARQLWRKRCKEFGFVEYVCNTCAYRELNPAVLMMKSAEDRLSSELAEPDVPLHR